MKNLRQFLNQSGVTNRIFVAFQSGLCGEFIISMLTGMRDPDQFKRMTVNDAGSCHENRRDEPEIVCRNRDELKRLLQKKVTGWIVKAHINIEDCDLLLQRYPDAKVICMTQDHPRSYQGFANWVTKAILAEWNKYGRDTYNKFSGQNPITEIKDITKIGIDALYKRFLDPVEYPMQVQSKMFRWPGRYFTFPVDVLYNDRQGAINMLEHISGYKINPQAQEFFDEYISKQPDKDEFLEYWNGLK